MDVKDHITQFRNKYATNHNNANNNTVKTKKSVKELRLSSLPNDNNGTIRIRGTNNHNNIIEPVENDFSITKDLLNKYIAEYAGRN